MRIKILISTFIGCLMIGSLSNANGLKDIQGINTLTDLMKNEVTLGSIKEVMSISDSEYDELRSLVLKLLIKDQIVSSTDYTFKQIGLGIARGRLFVENKEGNPLQLFVSAESVDVKAITGGDNFKKAFQDYINNYGERDQLSAFINRNTDGINLSYLVAVLNNDRTPLALNLEEYEPFHDTRSVLSGVIKSGVNAGKEWGEISFRKKNSEDNLNSSESITINTFGLVQFNPSVKIGLQNNPEARGSCMRKVSSCSMECVDNIELKACLSEEVFGGRSRCSNGVIWNQNLSCFHSKLIHK